MSALRPVRWLGAAFYDAVAFSLEVLALLAGAVAVVPFRVRTRGAVVLREVVAQQLRFSGVDALPLLGISALALATLVLTQAVTYVPVEFVPDVSAAVLVREAIPLALAVVLSGRSGTAIAVELASMRLSGELDALRAMGLPLAHVVVLPRLLGAVVAALGLTCYGLATAFLLGYLLSDALVPMPFGLGVLLQAVESEAVALALLKAALFGATIALVGVREGLSIRATSVEVPRAGTRAAVRGTTICLVLNSALSALL